MNWILSCFLLGSHPAVPHRCPDRGSSSITRAVENTLSPGSSVVCAVDELMNPCLFGLDALYGFDELWRQ